MNRVLVIGLAALMLAGCAVDAPSKERDPSASDTKEVVGKVESRSPIPEPTATLSSPPVTAEGSADTAVLEIECYSDDYSDKETVGSLEEAWASDLNCDESKFIGDGVNQALEEWRSMSNIDGLSLEDLELYISICAGRDYPWTSEGLSKSQIEESLTAVKVCPDHPDAVNLAEIIAASEELNALEASGDRVYNGTYYVPDDAKAGRWQSEGKVKDCYWEVTSASGNIVANNFARAGSKVGFTVEEGQSFTIDGACGAFVRQ